MMRITANGTEVEFDNDKMTFAEGRALERVTGQTYRELFEQKFVGNLTQLQALVWVACKRANPTLRFTDLDDWDMAAVEMEDDEPDQPEEPEAEPDPTNADGPVENEPTSPAPESSTQL